MYCYIYIVMQVMYVRIKPWLQSWRGTSIPLLRSWWMACSAGSGKPRRWKMQTTEQYLGTDTKLPVMWQKMKASALGWTNIDVVLLGRNLTMEDFPYIYVCLQEGNH